MIDHHTETLMTKVTKVPDESDRQNGSCISTICSVLYSLMDSDQMGIGDGTVTDHSQNGVGIRGTQPVNPGMDVTPFIDLPGIKEPFCLAQSRVSWVDGCRLWVA